MKAYILTFAASLLISSTTTRASEPIEFPRFSKPDALRECRSMFERDFANQLSFLDYINDCVDLEELAYQGAKANFEPILNTGHPEAQYIFESCWGRQGEMWLDVLECSEGALFQFKSDVTFIRSKETGQPDEDFEVCFDVPGTVNEFLTCVAQRSKD